MTKHNKKKLIEVALPLESINFAAMKEKDNPFLKGHPRALHQWFARRPLPTCRAILFAQMVDDPSAHPEKFSTDEQVEVERERLFDLMRELVLWENMTDQSVLDRARHEIQKSCNGTIPAVYDPFSGGGAIPFEAQRLGAKSFASDLNPVAVTLAKAMIEIPQRFWNSKPVHRGQLLQLHYEGVKGLSEDIIHYGSRLKTLTFEKTKHVFPEKSLPPGYGKKSARVIAWVWARTIRSPDPAYSGAETPLIASFVLCKKKGKEACVIAEINREDRSVSYQVTTRPTQDQMATASTGTKAGRGANFRCIFSGAAITSDYVKEEADAGRLGNVLVAVIAEGNRQRLYLSPDDQHIAAARAAARPDITDLSLPHHPQYVGVRGYGFKTFGDLFTSRQLLMLTTFTDGLEELRHEILADACNRGLSDDDVSLQDGGRGARAYAEAITVYLAFAIDKLADYNNSLCGWSNSNENVVHLFNRHALPMIWDFVEANPFGAMLDFDSLVKSVSSGISTCVRSLEGSAFQADAALTPLVADSLVISTDPPYYDNVPYADISDFFYLWLRRSLKSVFPDVYLTVSVPKSDEMVADRVRHGDPEAAEAFFLQRMKMALGRMATISSDEFPFAIYYAFKQSEVDADGVSSTGWSTFLQSIIEAGCSIVATWPVRTESQTRKRAVDSNALGSGPINFLADHSIH